MDTAAGGRFVGGNGTLTLNQRTFGKMLIGRSHFLIANRQNHNGRHIPLKHELSELGALLNALDLMHNEP